jgi:hypothetical protein
VLWLRWSEEGVAERVKAGPGGADLLDERLEDAAAEVVRIERFAVFVEEGEGGGVFIGLGGEVSAKVRCERSRPPFRSGTERAAAMPPREGPRRYRLSRIEALPSVPGPGAFHRRRGRYFSLSPPNVGGPEAHLKGRRPTSLEPRVAPGVAPALFSASRAEAQIAANQLPKRDRCNAPDRIRTCDLRFRRPTLYPAELLARVGAGRPAGRF